MLLFAHIRSTQHAQAFRVCGDNAVFNTVVNHFDEMAGTV